MQLLQLAPTCRKIDVEGAELSVLEGGVRTLSTHKPFVSLAIHPDTILLSGATLARIWELVSECGLAMVHDEAEVNREWFVAQHNLFDVQLQPRR